MSLCGLPHECLEPILNLLVGHENRSLVCLLKVNKRLYHATLPLIYSDAFRFHYTSPYTALYSPQGLKLVQTLLRQRPPEDVSDLLDAAYDVFPEHPPSNPEQDHDSRTTEMDIDFQEKNSTIPITTMSAGLEFDYLSYINDFRYLEVVIFKPTYITIGETHVQFDFSAYPHRLVNWASKSNHNPLCPPAYIRARQPSWLLSYGTLAASIRRDLTWTLCSPVFEQIRVMTIPLSDMGRYLDSIERFKSLKNVVFKMDEMWDVSYFQDALSQAETDDEVKELRRIRDRRDEQLKSMATFVKRHQALFPDVLQDVDCPIDTTWPKSVRCPKLICDRLKSLLLGTNRPTAINEYNVGELADRITSVDLRLVETIALEGRVTTLTLRDPSFLSRCRALKTLTINALGAGSFAWAVKERIAWEEEISRIGSSSSSKWSPLIPLEKLTLSTRLGFKDEPDDVVRAFGSTLSSAKFFDHSSTGTAMEEFQIGRGWSLPAMKEFRFSVGRTRLLVDPDMYTSVFGENLTQLSLSDRSSGYDVQDLYTCHPGSLPNLKYLTLEGWPALVFHPDTLLRAPNLKFLEIELYFMMKPRGELLASFQQGPHLTLVDGSRKTASCSIGRRVVWTWDWYLPRLHLLRLSSEFAYLFQFRMLTGCPSLLDLTLNMEVFQQAHSRVLSLNDFILVDGSTANDGSPLVSPVSSSSSAPLTSHMNNPPLIKTRIKRLTLCGAWMLDDDLRATVFKNVFPDLHYLSESGTSGYSLRGWVSALRELRRLENTFCRPVDMGMITADRLMDLDLVPLEHTALVGLTDSVHHRPGLNFCGKKWFFRGGTEMEAD